MKAGAARRRFYRLLEEHGLEPASLTPATGLDWMSRAYRTDRYRGCEPERGGDELSVRWGPRHWNRGDWFEVEVARRLFDEEAGKGRLLRLVFRFPVRAVEGPPPEGVLRCETPAAVVRFRDRAKRSAGFRAVAGMTPANVDLLFPAIR